MTRDAFNALMLLLSIAASGSLYVIINVGHFTYKKWNKRWLSWLIGGVMALMIAYSIFTIISVMLENVYIPFPQIEIGTWEFMKVRRV